MIILNQFLNFSSHLFLKTHQNISMKIDGWGCIFCDLL